MSQCTPSKTLIKKDLKNPKYFPTPFPLSEVHLELRMRLSGGVLAFWV
jgi:hypothetical protein